jgi:hypothetical protein
VEIYENGGKSLFMEHSLEPLGTPHIIQMVIVFTFALYMARASGGDMLLCSARK